MENKIEKHKEANLEYSGNESSGCCMDEHHIHRYALWRNWENKKSKVLFIGLNPSRADEIFNDPTITRCINFAKAWGFGGMYFANLFSFRTPYPKILVQSLQNSQAHNTLTDYWLKQLISSSEKIICCWGSWKFTGDRSQQVLDFIKDPYCLGVNKNGSPKHPLYLLDSTKPIQYLSHEKEKKEDVTTLCRR